jgi:hypothetical protein
MRDFRRLPAERETRAGQPQVTPSLLHLFEATAILLFLVQSVRVLFSVLFGLIYDTIFSGTVAFGVLDSLASDHCMVLVGLALP